MEFQANQNLKKYITESPEKDVTSLRCWWCWWYNEELSLKEICILYFCCSLRFISCISISKDSTNHAGELLQQQWISSETYVHMGTHSSPLVRFFQSQKLQFKNGSQQKSLDKAVIMKDMISLQKEKVNFNKDKIFQPIFFKLQLQDQ